MCYRPLKIPANSKLNLTRNVLQTPDGPANSKLNLTHNVLQTPEDPREL